MSKLRAIPQLPSGLDARTQQLLAALKENIEILGGQRGSGGVESLQAQIDALALRIAALETP